MFVGITNAPIAQIWLNTNTIPGTRKHNRNLNVTSEPRSPGIMVPGFTMCPEVLSIINERYMPIYLFIHCSVVIVTSALDIF